MIEHGKNGILCDTDSDSIRAAIVTLMKDDELKHTLGKNARNTIVENYSLNKILKLAELGKVIIVGSDVLSDELEEIVDTRKSMEVSEFITICVEHVDLSEEIIKLARSIEDECRVTGADALHISSSRDTKYFITCDGFIILKGKCITNFMKKRGYGVEVISITKFVEDKRICGKGQYIVHHFI